jgi:hypothetical protein
MDIHELTRILPMVAPLVLIQLVLMIAGVVDWSRRERTRGPKWVWLVVILIFSIIGPVAYFLIGREEV